MHDPDVVAHDVVLPIPVLAWPDEHGWRVKRRRRTNQENLGQPVYPWWRPKGYDVAAFGRRVRLYQAATIWHREPGGRDAGEVCKHHHRRSDGTIQYLRGWRWHVHHWHIQFDAGQQMRRRLLTRCMECGGRSTKDDPVNCSRSWDRASTPWWRGERGLTHAGCRPMQAARTATAGRADHA